MVNNKYAVIDHYGKLKFENNKLNVVAGLILGASGLFLVMGGSAFSHAQTAASGTDTVSEVERRGALEEIVVTAQRREERMQDVAISISTVTGDALANRGITSFSDLSRVTSGLYLEATSNQTSASLRIRGVGVRGFSASDPAVGVLVDDVYQVRPGTVFTEMLDVERIEVLRGPQGTMFGRNTTAGVIHVHTRDPDTEAFSGSIQGVVGNYSNREIRGVVNVPIMEGRLAARISGYRAQRDGYAKNVFLNEDTRNVDRYGGRVKLLWNATDDFSVGLSAETMDQKFRLEHPLVQYGPAAIATIEGSGLDPDDFPVSLGRAQHNRPFRAADKTDRYILNAEWHVLNHQLKSVTAYEEAETERQADQDQTVGVPSPPGLAGVDNANITKALTQEIQLSSAFSGPLSYVAGVFWQNEELESESTLLMGNNFIPRPTTVRDIDSIAFFGNVTYDFTEQWSASLGARYTEDERQGFSIETQDPEHIRTFREWTYSAKLQYQVLPDAMLYFSHDKGFKSGGFNRADLVMQMGPEFNFWEPEITYAYELGLKSEWLDRRLRVNAAIFYQDYEDYQVTQSIEGTGGAVVTNAAEVESRGVETEFAFAATPNLTLDGSASYIRTKYADYQNAPCDVNSTDRPGCVQVGNDFFQDLSGETLDNAPKWTANVGGMYRDELVNLDNIGWFVRADISYRGRAILGEFLAPESKQEAYALLNARAGLESTSGAWKLTLWGNNLTNKKYAIDSDFSNTGLTRTQGLPRTYGMTVDWNF